MRDPPTAGSLECCLSTSHPDSNLLHLGTAHHVAPDPTASRRPRVRGPVERIRDRPGHLRRFAHRGPRKPVGRGVLLPDRRTADRNR